MGHYSSGIIEQGFKLQLFWLPWQLANLAIDYLVNG